MLKEPTDYTQNKEGMKTLRSQKGLHPVSGWVSNGVSQLGGDLTLPSARAVSCWLTLFEGLRLLPVVPSPKRKVCEGMVPGE